MTNEDREDFEQLVSQIGGGDEAPAEGSTGDTARFELRRLFKPDIVDVYDYDSEADGLGGGRAGAGTDTQTGAAANAGEGTNANAGTQAAQTNANSDAGSVADADTGVSTNNRGSRRFGGDGTNGSRKGAVARNILLTLLCLAVGIAAALQYKTVVAGISENPDTEQRISELQSTILTLHSELGAAEAERDELQNRLNLVEQSSQDEQIAALRAELESVRTFAGLTSVKGRGVHVQVTFNESTNVSAVQSRLLMLINELRASGAQAISINGVRILAMSEIRVVNDQYIAVNTRQLVGPYDIYAIGDAANLYSGITMGGSGIVFQLNSLTGATCTYETQENIVIGGADDEEIKTDKLHPLQ